MEFLLPRGNVPELISRAKVLVLPSAFEGLPLVRLEARVPGLSAVTIRISGNVEALGRITRG